MKKVLLTGTALAGGMLFASVAQAQITVTLGGYTEFFAGFYDDDQPNRTEREFELETEIVVRADGKADNGLLYGAKVELQNSTGGGGASGVGTDEASVYLGGTWGRLELGDFDGAADTLKIYAPVIGIEQIDGDAYDFLANQGDAPGALNFGSQPSFGMHIPNSSDATKVMYLTPRFAGFQAGVSYATQSGSEAQNVVPFETNSGYKDWIEGGVNYTGEFSGFSISLGATISTADANDAGAAPALEDFTAWNVGGQVGFGGFVLGGGYVDADDYNAPAGPAGAGGGDQSVWHVGLSYTAGPIAIGGSYMDAEGFKDDTTYASDYHSYGVGAAYTLAPGFVVQSDLMFVDEEVRAASGGPDSRNEGWVFVLGTRLDF